MFMTKPETEQYYEHWKIPLLESYIEKIEEAFGNALSEIPIERDFINVLIRAYPQCILVLREVLCLLKNGYPDGALARARRIFESMIIAQYLNMHKEDSDFPNVIDRYFDDQTIRAYDGRKRYYYSMKQAEEINRGLACILWASMIDFEKSTASKANPGICRSLRTKYLDFAEDGRSNLRPVDDIYSV